MISVKLKKFAQHLIIASIVTMGATSVHGATVTVKFLTKDLPLPVKLYEPNSEKEKMISETKIVPTIKDLPVKKEYKNGKVPLKAGQGKSIVMVIENTTGKDLYFFVAPHTLHPEYASEGFYFECLCNHSIYRLNAGKVWYRVLRLNLGKDSKQARFDVDHQIVGLPEAVVKEKYSSRIYNAN